MMLSKDGTSILGKIGFLLPLLILFIAADAAACPEHRSGAALRTKAMKINNGGHMRTTVIGYRAPATYRLCGNTLRDTRGVAYMRDGGHRNGNGARYMAVRNGNSRMKYVAVRNIDRAPRYVAVRRSAPVYVQDSGVRYVAVRNGDRYYDRNRTRTIVRGIDIGPDPDYVAVRQTPIYVDNADRSYVSVRNVDRYDKVVVRDVDIDDEPGYVAVRNIDRLDNGTRYVAVRDRSDDFPTEIEEIGLHEEPLERRHVVEYSDAAYLAPATFVSADTDDACLLRDSPVVETRMVSYVEDDDIDDYAFLRVRSAAPAVASYSPASYAPLDDDVIELPDDDVEYVATGGSMNTVSYLPVDDDVGELVNGDVTYVTANATDDPCLPRVAVQTCPDSIDADEISYVPVDQASLETVSYVPMDAVENVSYVPRDDVETVSYVPIEETQSVSYVPVEDVETVSYVPVNNLIHSDVSEVDTVDCPLTVSSVDAAPLYVSDASTSLIEYRDADYDAGFSTTSRIAGDFGYRDGFKDGADAAAELDSYHPENSGDYKKATNGYEDTFGDKDLYKESYRSAYLTGYRAGFNSIGLSTNVG